jgi:hypothetical protein
MYLWLLYILIEIGIHYYIIEIKKSRPFYLHFFLQRGIMAILHGVLLDVDSWEEYMPIFLFQISSFWIFFDLGLNLMRDKKWWYKGKNSGWLDRLPVGIYWVLKSIVFIVFIITFIKNLQM